jgi:hypothetical protein
MSFKKQPRPAEALTQDHFILLAYVRQIVWVIEEETICLHNEDIISMKL